MNVATIIRRGSLVTVTGRRCRFVRLDDENMATVEFPDGQVIETAMENVHVGGDRG